MGKIVSAISALGKKQIGYAESPLGSNKTKYGVLWDTPKSKGGPYPFFNGKKNGQCGWCCFYVLWEIAMVLKDILGWTYDQIRVWLGMPKNPADNCGAGCPWLYKYFKAKGWEVDKKKGVQGDIIFFNTSAGKCTHVGRIESVLSGGKYKYIGGNQSNKVSYKTISMTSSDLYAVIHIPYETIEPKPDPSAVTYTVVTKYQHLEVRKEPTTKSEDVGDLAKGSTFTSSVVVKGESVHGCDAWVKVDKGYANGYYLSPTPVIKGEPKPEEPTPVVVEPPKPVVYPKYKVKTVTGEWLALRVAPKTGAVLIERMPYGSEVELIDTVSGEKVYGSNEWARVRYTAKNGTVFIGYCIKSRLKKV